VGKSELGLELISRGHGLVADDVVDIARLSADTLEGRCPAMLKDFIEVRGLGLLDVRTIFGETAVRPKMRLRLAEKVEAGAVTGLPEWASGILLSSATWVAAGDQDLPEVLVVVAVLAVEVSAEDSEVAVLAAVVLPGDGRFFSGQ
jgi:hypothetical protein